MFTFCVYLAAGLVPWSRLRGPHSAG
jgi:hypothetical protein